MRERIEQWFQFKRYNWRNYDVFLVVIVLALSLISSYVLSVLGETSFHRQLIAVVAGLVIVAVFSLIDYHDLCLYIPILYVIATLMAAATRLSPLGYAGGTGSYRWLDFKIIKFQPSEICKIVVILALASLFYRMRENLKTFKTFFLACAIAMLPTFFILIQSDLSSSVIIVMILVMMLISSGIGHRILGPVAIMRPSKSVDDLEVKSVKKKFKDRKFAAGCDRDVILRGAEDLGWELDELIEKTILAMRESPNVA